MIDIETPDYPGPGEALVRTHRMGICGTDTSAFLGKMPFFSYPRIPGHELGLEVLAVGPDVQNVKAGDRCALEPYVNDPSSLTSQRGASNCCPGLQVLGVHTDGGLREQWLCPARKLHPGNALSFDQLALVEPLAIGYHAVQRTNPQKGESVLVIGAGPIGLACLEFLRLRETDAIAMDLNRQRLSYCKERLGLAHTIYAGDRESSLETLHTLTNGQLADVVIDATGSAQSMSTCFEFAAFAGRAVYVGVTAGELKFPHAPVFHRRELTLMASRNALPDDFKDIIEIIQTGQIRIENWISHRLPFDEVPQRFKEFCRPDSNSVKAVIELS